MTTTMNHTDIQPLLADYRDLRGAERAAVDAHIAACAMCARTLAEYQTMDVAIQGLRDAPADPALRARYHAALAGPAAPSRPAPRRALTYTLAAVAATLVVALVAWTLLRPTGPGGTLRVAQDPVPAAKNAEVGAFVWQTDGVYGYRVLRPTRWQPVDTGLVRDFVAPAAEGQAPLILHVVNLRAKAWGDIPEGMNAYLSLFESAPTLEGWSANLRQGLLDGAGPIEVGAESADVFVWTVNDGSGDRILLMALKVSQGDPLIMGLETRFAATDLDALRTSGMQDDFVTMVNSLSVAPFDAANVAPWAPTATPTATEPPRTPLPTSPPVTAAATATPDPRLVIWPDWEEFEQALSEKAFGAHAANPVCDWTVLSRDGNSFYVWAVCAAHYTAVEAGAPDLSLASFPAVLRVSDNNMAVGALVPRDGTLYEEDIKTLFPPAVQQQIADRVFDAQYPALEAHARLRLTWPLLPPLGAAETAPADPDALGAKASIRIFSGREDPAWMFTHRELDQLDALLTGLDPIQCPPIPDRLGYRGVAVILGPNDAGTLIAGDGYMWPGDAASNPDARCFADPDRAVERFLLSSSQPYVDADTFNLISTLLPQPLPTPLVSPTPTPTLAPGWAAYGDETLDIQFKHPETWEVTTRTPWSLVYSQKAAPPQGEAPMLPPPFWVTVVMWGFDNADASAYNFWTPEEITQAWNTPVGETFVSPHAPAGYNTYTRLPDITVDGFPAAVVNNATVWEAPQGTQERRVLVKVGEATVMIGTYYTSDAELLAFEQVLASVKFGDVLIKRGVLPVTPEAAPTANPTPAPRIVFSAKREAVVDLFSMASDGSDLRQLTHGPEINMDPACSPDGRRIAFSAWRNGAAQIYVIDADGGNERQLTTGPANHFSPAWSPDGSRLIYTAEGEDAFYLMAVDGAQQMRLPVAEINPNAPAFSPDGETIVYSATGSSGRIDLRIAALDGSSDTAITDGLGFYHQPRWSPDGSRIAFYAQSGNHFEIFVMDKDATGRFSLESLVRRLTDTPDTGRGRNSSAPSWSPDNSRIAFDSDRDGGSAIWVMNADGSAPIRLTEPSMNASSSCWLR